MTIEAYVPKHSFISTALASANSTLNLAEAKVLELYGNAGTLLNDPENLVEEENYTVFDYDQEAIDLGREQTTSEIRNYQSTVDKLLNKLSDKISGGFNYITFSDNGIEQAKHDEHGKKLNAKNKKKQESEVKSVEQIKQALIGYFKDPELFTDNPEFTRAEILEFLTAAANGEILSMDDIMTIGTDEKFPRSCTNSRRKTW